MVKNNHKKALMPITADWSLVKNNKPLMDSSVYPSLSLFNNFFDHISHDVLDDWAVMVTEPRALLIFMESLQYSGNLHFQHGYNDSVDGVG